MKLFGRNNKNEEKEESNQKSKENLTNSGEDIEKNEYTQTLKKIGKDMSKTIKLDLSKIKEAQTARIMGDKTQRIGESKESTIVQEFWNYYQQFSSDNLPSEDEYYGGEEAEMKISVLINLFEALYLEEIYPNSFPVPIIQESFVREKNPTKIFIVGDTHGCFIDTVKLIQFFKEEIEKGKRHNYKVKVIFIGDFVDRGHRDIHNLLYIMAFNLKYRKNVLLLRGNHEEISICAHYGFGQRVMKYFSQMTFASFTYMFKDLPLISHYHCENGNIMCLHGGVPIILEDENDYSNYKIPQLNIHKFNNRKIYLEKMDDVSQQILWNDPILKYDSNFHEKFFPNKRGVGFTFGKEIYKEFCEKNHVDLLFRGHQVFSEGYHKHFEGKYVTLFSASDYVNMKIASRFAEVSSDDIENYKIHQIQELSG